MQLATMLEDLKVIQGKDAIKAIRKMIAGINDSIEKLEIKRAQLAQANMTPSIKAVDEEIGHYKKSKDQLKSELKEMIEL